MLKEIKGLSNQHPIDVCLQGQANLDAYVQFLQLNSNNSNQAVNVGMSYKFVPNNQDTNAEELIRQGVRYASIDKVASKMIDKLTAGASITIYSIGVEVYGEIISI